MHKQLAAMIKQEIHREQFQHHRPRHLTAFIALIRWQSTI
jgi:hypothetical protein